MPKANDEYIGDGVYLSDDGYQLWLAANDHHNRVVALDRETFIALIARGARRIGVINGSVDEGIVDVLRRTADAMEALAAPAEGATP